MFENTEYVYMVYKEKSFSKAAKKLFISQPSLSATIKRVEDRLGCPIFDRSTKPLGLTECGEKYIRTIEQIQAITSEFTDFVNDWGALKTGKLVLGGSTLFSSWIFPPLMGTFTHSYPHVRIELIEENTAELAHLLQNGQIDLMIDNCLLDKNIFDSRVYCEEHLLLAVPRQFSVNKQAHSFQLPETCIRDGSFAEKTILPVPLSLFRHEPFIMLKAENDTRKRAIDILKNQGISPNIIFELDQQLTSYNVTCSEMGISFISDTLIKHVPPHPNVVYYKLGDPLSRRFLYFYWKTGRYFSRAMEEFLHIAGL